MFLPAEIIPVLTHFAPVFTAPTYQKGLVLVEGFAPPAPFTLSEQDADGLSPERPYTKDELQAYLDHGRTKCQATIEALTGETAQRRCRFAWGEVRFAELLLCNMRHVQEHAAQLSLLLGQEVGAAPGWVAGPRSRA